MNKFKLIVGLVALLATIYFVDRGILYVKGLRKDNDRLFTELVGQKQAYKQLSDHAAELAIQYQSQDQLRKELQQDFADEKQALVDRINLLSDATFLIKEKAKDSKSADLTFSGDKVKYAVNEIKFENGPPVGYVLIFSDGKTVSKMYDHDIQVETAVTRNDDSGRYEIVSKANYVLKSPSVSGSGSNNWYNKPFPLDITGGQAEIDPTIKNQLSPHLQLWAPHINAGMEGGASLTGPFLRPSLDFSFSGYGVTKNDLDWKFLHLGGDIDTKLTDPGVHLLPLSYRFWGSVLSNTYVGPGLGVSKQGWNAFLDLNFTL